MKEYINIIALVTVVFLISFIAISVYILVSNLFFKNEVIGLSFESGEEELTYQEALSRASSFNPSADWVCVDVKKGDIKKMYETCVHECTHQAYSEIFAEKCEKNYKYCKELIDNITK